MLTLAHQNLLILGLGDSGLAMAQWGVFCGANVWVADNREDPPQLQALRRELPQAQFVCASLDEQLLTQAHFDGVFKSPGLSPQSLSKLWQAAAAQGVRTGNELTLFAQALNELKAAGHYQPDVLVVTGTNGKTTVTRLCAQMLQKAKKRVAVAGNIGPTLLGTLRAHLTHGDLEALRDLHTKGRQRAELEQAQTVMVLNVAIADAGLHTDNALPENVVQGGELARAADAYLEETLEAPHNALHSVLEAESFAASEDIENIEDPKAVDDEGVDREETTQATAVESIVVSPEPIHSWASEHALPDVWVLEISSFQAFGVTEFEPTAAVILNITEDHLDWHADMKEYRAAKVGLFAAQTCRIIHRDDPEMLALRPNLSAKSAGFKPNSAWGRRAREALPKWVEYGAGAPERGGDFGIEQGAGMTWLVRAHDDEPGVKPDPTSLEGLPTQRLMPLDALKIRGPHNALNAMAALALACTTRAHMAPLLHALKDYGGEAHRLQTIRVLDGVQYVDDSKGTNVGATCAALAALGQEGPLVVILGGVGKGQDFSPLLEPVAKCVRAVILMGEDGPKIKHVLEPLGKTMITVQSMAQAVVVAQELAKSGDAVLLSPACASFDMFKDYAHRAQAFQLAVNDLVAAQPHSLAQEVHHG